MCVEMEIFDTVLVCVMILMQRDSEFVGSVVGTFCTFVGIVVIIIISTFLRICTKTGLCDFTIIFVQTACSLCSVSVSIVSKEHFVLL